MTRCAPAGLSFHGTKPRPYRPQRLEHGQYPETLADLVPKYVGKNPIDLFTDKPLTYRPEAAGYLLYSFGPTA